MPLFSPESVALIQKQDGEDFSRASQQRGRQEHQALPPGFYLLRNTVQRFLLKNQGEMGQTMKVLRMRFQPSTQPCAAGR